MVRASRRSQCTTALPTIATVPAKNVLGASTKSSSSARLVLTASITAASAVKMEASASNASTDMSWKITCANPMAAQYLLTAVPSTMKTALAKNAKVIATCSEPLACLAATNWLIATAAAMMAGNVTSA